MSEPSKAALKAAKEVYHYVSKTEWVYDPCKVADWSVIIDSALEEERKAADALAAAVDRMAYWSQPVRGEFMQGPGGDEAFAKCKSDYAAQMAALAAYRERRAPR